MATDTEKLLIRLEVTQRKFEKQLADAYRTTDRRARGIESRFRKTNRSVSRSFDRMSRSASSALRTVSRLAIAAAAALGTREIARYADAWTRVNNQIKAAEQISGTTARATSRLNDIANETRSGLEETANLYARMIRVSGDLGASEMEVAQATEIVTKAFKAGGAAASEQASAVLQLSQALSSGELMGEELRAIRENAPLLAQAIADEFETTIGGLKELGAEGELTADRVFRAIINGQEKIEEAFAATEPTIREGFTALRNGMMELVGAFNEGAGASDGLTGSLSGLGEWLSNNAESARRFGAQVSEAFEVVGEAIDAINEKFGATFDGIVAPVRDASTEIIGIISEVMQAVVSISSGIAAAIQQAFIKAIAAVGDGGVAIANSAIGAVEAILDGILDGVRAVVSSMNALIATANKLPGVDLPSFGQIGRVNLGRITNEVLEGSDKSIKDAFVEAAQESSKAWQDWEDGVIGSIRRVRRAGEKPFDPNDPRGDQMSPPSPSAPRTTSPTSGTSGGSGKGGGGGKSQPGLFDEIRKQRAALEQEIAMIGMTQAEVAELTARYELLAEAKKRGLNLDQISAETGRTLREEIDMQAAAIGRLVEKKEQLAERTQFMNDLQDQFKEGLIDAIVEGENLSGVLQDLAKSFAKASLEAALFGTGPFSGGAAGPFGDGGGLLGGLFGGIFGRASGGPVRAGQPYLVNENTPNSELFVPSRSGAILNVQQAQQALSSMRGGAAASVAVEVFVRDDGTLGAIARQSGADAAMPVAVRVVEQNNKRLAQQQKRT